MKHLFSTFFIFLLATFPVAEGQGQTYVVRGGPGRIWNLTLGVEYFDGVFEKAKEGGYYVKLGFWKNHYIYNVIQDKMAYWVLGRSDPNRTHEQAKAVFKSKGTQRNGPNLTDWVDVYDGSHKGESLVPKNNWERTYLNRKKVEKPGPPIFPVKDKTSGVMLLRLGGLETEGGVLCNSQNSQQWLFLEGSDRRICDAMVRSGTKCQCKNCFDGTLCKGVQKIPTERLLKEKRFNNQKGLFCEDQKKFWIYLRNNSAEICDNKCLCKNCWDEEGCPRKGNVTREQLVDEKGMQTEDGVACEGSGKRWQLFTSYIYFENGDKQLGPNSKILVNSVNQVL